MSNVKDDVPTLAWEPKPGYPGIAVGTLVIFGGRPAAGKSTSARWFVAEATKGTLPGAWRGMPVGAAWIGTEESEIYMMKPGLRAAGADLDKVVIPEVEIHHHDDDGATVVPILYHLDMDGLASEFNSAGIKVVVLDPLMSAVGSRTDVNRSNEVRARLEPWVKLAEAIDGVVIGIAHLKKSFTGDVVAALNGSSAFGEVARSIFGFAKDDNADDGTRLMSHAKSSIGPESLSYTYSLEPVEVTTDSGKTATVSRFVLGEETDRTVSDALREAASGGPPAGPGDKPMSDKAAMLVQILTGPNGALLAVTKDDAVAQMAEAGYSADQTRRAREELAKRCRIGRPFRDGGSGPYYWKLLPFVPPNGNQNDTQTTGSLPSCHPAPDLHVVPAIHPQDGKDGRLADSPRAKGANHAVTNLDSRRSHEPERPKLPATKWLANHVADLQEAGHTTANSFAVYEAGQAAGYSINSLRAAASANSDISVIASDGRSATWSIIAEEATS
ncbi:AAA family ATPase [Mycobacterium sp. UM_WGJ]|uniref:AAA family ATPase n=1 Tax=Mycobacterium sp. UM_WGJ TaxID=1370120 RepID=UPI00042258BA|nr:AAA family ATPase [Mycobacterium sp. UM_WGJ]